MTVGEGAALILVTAVGIFIGLAAYSYVAGTIPGSITD